tara:strand:+ start:2116 stop:3369 length:1254 start_codon:yes stop_codon:yes gene_type:complete
MLSSSITAQDEPYSFTFAPDLWYNDVDGIRTGIRVLGEVEGTFKDGPHRLDAGLWLGAWFPDNPVSYYVSFIEPIKAISDYGNEGSVQVISSIRTGYSQHKLQFNKRWQPEFDEYNYREISISFSRERLLDSEYRPFPILWQKQWKSLIGLNALWSANPDIGQFLAKVNINHNISKEIASFSVGTIELLQRIDLNKAFKLRLRAFAGFGTEDTAPEYLFLSSMNSPITWLNNGVSRAKGTIPTSFLEAGSFQVGGGANLRGYLNREINLLNTVNNPNAQFIFPLYKSMVAFNSELEFPNLINDKLKNISIIGDLMELRTYLFVDIGKGDDYTLVQDPDATALPDIIPSLVTGVDQEPQILADAGFGLHLSFNIPDYLGKDRGLFIRYDIPFWLSDVSGSESNFAFRQLIGLGAIFSF